MSRGYICLAQNNSKVDYLQQAYALALNLKLTQSEVDKLTVCVDPETKKLIKPKHEKVFDKIVDIPWGDAAADAEWKVNNKWKFYYMSPYEETVILDTDMIFPSDVGDWWKYLSAQDVWATTHVHTFRGEVVTNDYYRKVFTEHNLPNVYMAFFYFKKSQLAAELFSMIEIIFQHWQRYYFKYLPGINSPKHVSGDVSFALAMKLLGIEAECTRYNVTSLPTFVHMKPHVQNSDVKLSENWCESIPTYYNDFTDFKVGNFQQYLPFHYIEKKWMTAKKIRQMEMMYGHI